MKNKLISMWLLFFIFNIVNVTAKKPHVIVIVADDLGWNDVGFHGSVQIPTPNIDALAYSGVILNNYYVQPICTPSRSALLSGMHPIHTGLQHGTIGAPHPYALPLSFKLLPEYLNDIGYTSKIIGKWHIGHYKKVYTPVYRGFQSHYGYWSGRVDYYSRTSFERPGWWGYDFRRNMNVEWSAYGKYATDLFTEEAVKVINKHNSSDPLFLYLAHLAVHSGNPYDPLQAPSDIVKKFSYIKDENRRKFAGMLWKLDESVGKVVKALEDAKMLENCIIVFTTDNGGPAGGFNSNAASNWPLRGVKASMWEGGIRGAGLVWSSLIKDPGRVSTGMMQIIDWLPTLYKAAGGHLEDLPHMDGMDMWETISEGVPSPRHEMLHNIDPIIGGAGIRAGDWKLVYKPSGYGPKWDGWFGPSGRHPEKTFIRDEMMEEELIKGSLTGRIVGKYVPKYFKKLKSLKKAAQVLCAPVPKNATKECNNSSEPCLFHIPSDPCEYFDVSKKYPGKVHVLQDLLERYNSSAVPPANKPWDPKANPIFWSYTWTHWRDFKIGPVAEAHLIYPTEDDSSVMDHIWL